MEALRAAGRAVLRSPRLARHGLGLRRRRKLPESWADMQEPLLEGMCFTLKYLGMTLVEKPKGEDMAAAAIRRIVATARVGARKFQKVILTVSPRGISLQDADTKEMVENISIYRISYCTTDKLQNKVFAYVAQSQESGALECHAFLSPKKKIAQAVTLTVAQAFQMALDLWEATHAGSRQDQPLHPSCVLESSEASRPCEPVPAGSTPFTHHFGEEEEEEEEDDNVGEALSGINTSCAPIELSYSTATVLPPGAAPGQLGRAGRGWRLPLHWHQDCWIKFSPGLSQISATTDQPLRIHPVPAPGPASACCCPGTARLARGLLALLPWSAQAAAPAPCPVLPA
ncbi:low density lipoprotein receptor adapter protein 1-like [Serinus canaria]|uniref:low density lipoprotein receptor adapter protein 1-like n=1 Tax=Serinus canaria TaxID=9135 RepID=UPI0011AE9E52|nr:low density lipoprotein receptor adapter protein 1-like [Serinus canaria]